MAAQTRARPAAAPRPRPAVALVPAIVDDGLGAELGPPERVPSPPPPFDPNDPRPGQSIRGLVPHRGYSSYADSKGRSWEIDPETDTTVREIV